MSQIFCPDHKAAMVMFLDRVYGVQDQQFLLRLLESGFLPDLQAAVNMDSVRRHTCLFLVYLKMKFCYWLQFYIQ